METKLKPYNSGPFRLLVVEDEFILRTLIVKALQAPDREIVTAINGLDALERLKETAFDAVISDISMPALGGLALLADLRSRGLQIPFVFVTAYRTSEIILQALDLGANGFMEKPFDKRVLCDVADMMLRLGRALRSSAASCARLVDEPSTENAILHKNDALLLERLRFEAAARFIKKAA